ncbi:MAG: hypothetical protein QOI66_2259 [Myxococcales bacterium]|jgi:hypothetical protein|nr:hypothetical protein [Myxococcales bacterium]
MRTAIRWRHYGRTIAFVIAILLDTQGVRAADVDSAEALIKQGIELRQQGHDVRALPLFRKAYEMARNPRTAAQLGFCEMALGYWVDAENHLSEAMDVPEHPWVAKNTIEIAGALSAVRRNITTIVVDGEPPGAEVVVNHQVAGRLPLNQPVRLGRGIADIEVRAPGYVAVSRSMKIPGGTSEHVTIVLSRNASARNISDGLQSGPTKENESPRVVSMEKAPASPSQEEPGHRNLRTAALVTASSGALAIIFGAIETVVWIKKYDEFQDHTGPLPASLSTIGRNCGRGEMNYGGSGCQPLYAEMTTARTLAIVGYGLGAVLGVTSGILLATSRPNSGKSDVAFTYAPDFVHRGIVCNVSF